MVKIQIDNDVYTIPERWSEMSTDEMLYLAKLTTEDLPEQQIKLFMLLHHLKAHVGRHRKIYGEDFKVMIGKEPENVKFRIGRRKYLLSPEEINELSALYGFLFTRKKEKYSNAWYTIITPEFPDINPFPKFTLHFRTFTGPSEYFFNICFEQFMFLQTYLDHMADDPEAINGVLACLWHTGKKWNAHRIEKDARILKHLSPAKKMVMYWFITSCMQSWSDNYPRIFCGEGKAINGVFDSQQRLLNMLANGDITKKPEIRESNIMDAFYTIDEAMRAKEESGKK